MACPACGSTDLFLIAPNWVECTATWERRHLAGRRPVFGPGRFPQVVGEIPIFAVETIRCGVRHHRVVQAGSGSWPLCECGTFAIGVCRVCGTPVCGDDSTRLDRQRVCLSCEAQAKFEADRPRIEAERRAQEERRQAEAERRQAEEERLARLNVRAQEMAEQIARHGPCRAYPRHPASYSDPAGNCKACVVGLR